MTDTEKIEAIKERLLVWSETATPQSTAGIAWTYAFLVQDITEIVASG